MDTYYRVYALPWELELPQRQAFQRTLKKVLIATVVLSLLITFLPVPEPDPNAVVEVPQRFARLLLEHKPPPPPEPVVQPRQEELKPEPKIEEQKVVKPDPVVEPVVPKIDRTEKAREKAAMAGLLPFADDLADLRDNQVLASVSNSRDLAGATGEGARTERSLITSSAGKASGGINTAGMSRNTGGSGLVGRDTTQVSSNVASLAGNAPQRSGESDRPARSREEVEMVFDKNKGAIYALYNRALRKDPGLQGKVVLRLTIEPSGAVSACEIISSELADPELERKLVQRVKLFRFLEKDVLPVTTTKPIDFFPA